MPEDMVPAVAVNLAALLFGVAFCVWFVRSRAVARRRMVGGMFADRYGTCLSCGLQPIGHTSWLLGIAVVSREPNRSAELERLVQSRDWDRARALREFEGTEDEIEYRVIKCPSTNQLSLKKILTTFELWSNDRVPEDIQLTAADQARMDALAGEEWTLLRPGT